MKNSPALAAAFLVGCLSALVPSASAQSPTAPPLAPSPSNLPKRAAPPTRSPTAPGTPRLTPVGAKPGATALRGAPGMNPPADADGDFLIGPDYVPAPELAVKPGIPRGTVQQFTMDSRTSKFYNPGIARGARGTIDPQNPRTVIVETHPVDFTRTITVYIPAHSSPGTAAPFIVVHDGPPMGHPDLDLPRILDNLIAQRRVPPMIAIMIGNGGGDAQGSERNREYDTMSGKFAEFIEAEVLPLLEKKSGLTLTRDPNGRATMGRSSGGAAALIMAWYHPELYHRVITYSGTFVNQQWPFDPAIPGGAWELHEKLVPQNDRKPIRLWMEVGDRDVFNPNHQTDGMHDWVAANNRLATALKAKGYSYQYVFALNARHVDPKVFAQTLPEALEWVWKGYPIPATTP